MEKGKRSEDWSQQRRGHNAWQIRAGSTVCASSLARTSLWDTGPNPVYETGKEIAKWTEEAIGNNDTHQNNAAESWSRATWLCNDNQHLFTLSKWSRGLCNTTASPQLLRNWWLGYSVPDSGHHDNKLKRVSLCQASVPTKCKNQKNHFRKYFKSLKFLWTSLKHVDVNHYNKKVPRCHEGDDIYGIYLTLLPVKPLLAHIIQLKVTQCSIFNSTMAKATRQQYYLLLDI